MGIFKLKAPFFADLDTGRFGTYVDKEPDPSDRNLVWIYWVPIGSLSKKKYSYPIPNTAIRDFMPTDPQAERHVKVIYRGGNGSLLNELVGKLTDELKKANDKISQLNIAVATARADAEKARAGSSALIAKERALFDKLQPKRDINVEAKKTKKAEDFI